MFPTNILPFGGTLQTMANPNNNPPNLPTVRLIQWFLVLGRTNDWNRWNEIHLLGFVWKWDPNKPSYTQTISPQWPKKCQSMGYAVPHFQSRTVGIPPMVFQQKSNPHFGGSRNVVTTSGVVFLGEIGRVSTPKGCVRFSLVGILRNTDVAVAQNCPQWMCVQLLHCGSHVHNYMGLSIIMKTSLKGDDHQFETSDWFLIPELSIT